ncbi:MAG: hypothetical protein CVU81_02535, partial [Euryarchaeota archaeon HGW-Euryarchaeota-1]
HLTKIYVPGENEDVRKEREIELSLIHKDFYDEKEDEDKENKFKKRAIIFSAVGPEIYEF